MATGGLATYLQAHFARCHDEGYVGLCIAENHQVFELLRPKLETIPAVPAHVASYDDFAGKESLRAAIAILFEGHIFGRPVDPSHVQVLAGAGGVLDAVGHALGDPGDGILVPTPSYSGFWPDLQVRPGLRIVEVPTPAGDGFRLTPDLLEEARAQADAPIKALLLTNPDNPRGQVMATADVQAVLEWAEDKGLHVIADEIYALSTFGPDPFVSVGRLREDLGSHLHVVWAFSKDFGMSGLRCGVLISQNQALRDAIALQGVWSGVSGHTQHVLAAMLADQEWVQDYLDRMREGLASTAVEVTAALTRAGLAHLTPQAGFFVLCDLRGFLAVPTWQAEHDLWSRILETTGVNLTPGSACHIAEPGFFRLCFANFAPDVVVDAISRVRGVLQAGPAT